jgi:hypothetical protein
MRLPLISMEPKFLQIIEEKSSFSYMFMIFCSYLWGLHSHLTFPRMGFPQKNGALPVAPTYAYILWSRRPLHTSYPVSSLLRIPPVVLFIAESTCVSQMIYPLQIAELRFDLNSIPMLL